MLKSEKGYTLLLVMLMVVVFTVLGLTILSVSISSAKRTEVRKENIVDNLDAVKTLNKAVAYIKSTIHDKYTVDISISDYNKLIQDEIISNPYGYHIEDDRPDLTDFTRVLRVTSNTQDGESYEQIVYITAMPSFLKYAVGSRDTLTLNGSLFIKEGNIYANNKLEITNQAKYIFNDVQKIVDTSLPTVLNEDNNYLFLENENILSCFTNCYNTTSDKTNFLPVEKEGLGTLFNPTSPTLLQPKTDFIEVDIIKTFIEKLISCGFNIKNTANKSDSKLLTKINNSIKNVIKKNGTSDIRLINSFNEITNSDNSNYLFNGDAYIDTNNVAVDSSKWIVINGNAYFENSGNDTMNISANILVTGNVSIKGKLAFNSVMYVLGDTQIDNVDISGINNGELILMTQGNLEIAKVNKFQNPNISNLSNVNSIKAFLYTNSDATVYAIGSYIYINGGLFAHGNLEVNAFRGKTFDNTTDLRFEADVDKNASRFIVENNKRLFLDQSQGLPKVEQLEVITDLMKKD